MSSSTCARPRRCSSGFVGEPAGRGPGGGRRPGGRLAGRVGAGGGGARRSGAGVGRRSTGFFGETTFESAIDRFANFDLVVHRWDLARATGGDDHDRRRRRAARARRRGRRSVPRCTAPGSAPTRSRSGRTPTSRRACSRWWAGGRSGVRSGRARRLRRRGRASRPRRRCRGTRSCRARPSRCGCAAPGSGGRARSRGRSPCATVVITQRGDGSVNVIVASPSRASRPRHSFSTNPAAP